MATGFRALRNKLVWVEEAGEGPAVLGIHGLGGTCNIYGPQIAALAGACRIVTFDLNGHGMSPMVGPVSIENWADDAVALMDDLELDSVALLSHSMGTLVAQQVMAVAGERVRASAFLGPVRNLPDAARSAQADRAVLVRAQGMAAVAGAISQGAVSAKTRSDRPVVAAMIKELLQRQSAEGYAAACEALGGSSPPDVSRVTCPVLAITGTEDMVCPPDSAHAIAGDFSDGSAAVIDDIGHWTTLEAPAEVNDLLADFLKTA
ncbi:MAG: alpha/beta hydrolase [bacterium]|nr:alpha/beta hydrolase [bacterium]